MKMKKVLALGLIAMMSTAAFAGCGSSESSDGGSASTGDSASASGQVYYLNFKPEADEAWQEIAAQYTEETGVPVTVITAASGTYEETLSSEIIKDEAPTLFQVNGPVGLANWKDYCYDLKGSSLYDELTSDSFALYDGDAVAGIAYVIESYGLIVNTELLEQAGYTIDDIASFDDLKTVAEDITARSSELGFSAFTSAGMDGSSDWRFKTHLANLPIYFEYQDKGIDSTDAIEGTYLDNYKAMWDLYINNATCDPSELAGKTGDDAENEFAEGQAVFYQNGSWEYSALSEKYSDDELAMIPIYVGVEGEENQGLCSGTENCWAVNANASEEDIQATLDFMKWMVTSEEGTKCMAEQFGVIPYKGAQENTNLFIKQGDEMREAGKYTVDWTFNLTPNVDDWRAGVVSAINQYDAGGSWDDVVSAFVDGWATQYQAAQQ